MKKRKPLDLSTNSEKERLERKLNKAKRIYATKSATKQRPLSPKAKIPRFDEWSQNLNSPLSRLNLPIYIKKNEFSKINNDMSVSVGFTHTQR
jgi:hypothetical protein